MKIDYLSKQLLKISLMGMCAFLLLISLDVFAADLTMDETSNWALDGDLAGASEGDNVDIDGDVILLLDKTAAIEDGGTANFLGIGNVTNSSGEGNLQIGIQPVGVVRDLNASINSVNINGNFGMNQATSQNRQTMVVSILNDCTVGGTFKVQNFAEETYELVTLTVEGNYLVTGATLVQGGPNEVGPYTTLTLNGQIISSSEFELDNVTGPANLVFSGTNSQTVTGVIYATTAGEGVLTAGGGNADIVFNNNVGTTSLSDINLAGSGSTTFEGTVAATNIDVTGTGTTTFNGNVTSTLDFEATGSVVLGADIIGNVTYSSGAGRLSLNGDRNISGTLTLANSGSVNLGANTLTLGGVYTQNNANQTLYLTINDTSTFGKIDSSGANASFTAGIVDVTVGNTYLADGTTYKILDGGDGGTITVADIAVTDNSYVIDFIDSASSGDLTLTAVRTNSYDSVSSQDNIKAAGEALEAAGAGTPSDDMVTVLNTLDGLSASEIGSAIDTMNPPEDTGVFDTCTASLKNFVGVSMGRTKEAFNSLRSTGMTGISTGDGQMINAAWVKGYGSYLEQDERKGVKGYSAWNTGTALGVDRLFNDNMLLGISGGYGYGKVDSDANNAKTLINSAQAIFYGGYQNENDPLYVNAAVSFAWNWYNGRRDISLGTIIRGAEAKYDGQQYGTYMEGGYHINTVGNLYLTPIASLNYIHLRLNDYTETGAGALNLRVAAQDYDILQSGLGVKIEYPVQIACGTVIPEVHGRWIYDFIGDKIQQTSQFTGDGGSFDTKGAEPEQHSFNVGGKISFESKKDISLVAECDTELKDKFWGIYSSISVRYAF